MFKDRLIAGALMTVLVGFAGCKDQGKVAPPPGSPPNEVHVVLNGAQSPITAHQSANINGSSTIEWTLPDWKSNGANANFTILFPNGGPCASPSIASANSGTGGMPVAQCPVVNTTVPYKYCVDVQGAGPLPVPTGCTSIKQTIVGCNGCVIQ